MPAEAWENEIYGPLDFEAMMCKSGLPETTPAVRYRFLYFLSIKKIIYLIN